VRILSFAEFDAIGVTNFGGLEKISSLAGIYSGGCQK